VNCSGQFSVRIILPRPVTIRSFLGFDVGRYWAYGLSVKTIKSFSLRGLGLEGQDPLREYICQAGSGVPPCRRLCLLINETRGLVAGALCFGFGQERERTSAGVVGGGFAQ